MYETYAPPADSSVSQVSLAGLALFSGTPSAHSLTQSCQGEATLEFQVDNPSSSTVHISDIVIYGSGLKQNATTLVPVSNSCLSLGEANPVIEPNSVYSFQGYADEPLPFGTSYYYVIELDNGQTFNGTLIAQV